MGILHSDQDLAVRRGLAYGSDAVLTPEFIAEFPNATLNSFTFSDPTLVSESEYIPRLVNELTQCVEKIDTMPRDSVQVVIGGDHSVTCASLIRILLHYKPTDVGVLHIDTHGDIHLRSTSPSGNFHGMFLRPFFDTFDIPEIDALVPHKLSPSQLISIGNADFQPEEWEFYRTHGIQNISSKELEEQTTQKHEYLGEFISRFKHIHLSFDIDVFDASVVTATGMPNPHGLTRAHIFPVLEILRTHPSISLDLMEINPSLPHIEQTATVARNIIRTLFTK